MSALGGSGGDLDQDSFDKIFTHQSDGFNHILLTDVEKIYKSLADDFKEVLTVESIGKTWEHRDITLITIDARQIVKPAPPTDSKSKSKK